MCGYIEERRNKAMRIIQAFTEKTASPETELIYTNPFQLLVAVILSAQCTDKRVNIITSELFRDLPDAAAIAHADYETLFSYIKTCSYPNNKTRHIKAMAEMLLKEYRGIVPSDLNALQKLPGVGRKTANVVASVAFKQQTIPVDTHVFRVSQRTGLVSLSKTTLEVENKLLQIIPEHQRNNFHHWMILHGRYTCKARKPLCQACIIRDYCDYFRKTTTGA
jgi:endonuclease III